MPPVVDDAIFRFTEMTPDAYAVEVASASTGRAASMRWSDLHDPFAVALPPAESATGGHEMFSVFRLASAVHLVVDGATLPGSPVKRMFLGREGPSAALALSETWVRAS